MPLGAQEADLDHSILARTTQSAVYVDAMFLHLAVSHLSIAKEAATATEKLYLDISSLDRYDDFIAYDLGDEIDPDWKPGELAALSTKDEALFGSFRQLLESVATVHVFCAATLEAHINCRGLDMLQGRMYEAFQKISLDGKWLMFPKLVGAVGFDPGQQPFQNFSNLIRIRNGLVHHKSASDKASFAPGPVLRNSRGLTIADAEKSVMAARGMIRSLAEMLGGRSPWWLTKDAVPFVVFSDAAVRNDREGA
jgi:hypothetical protein